MNFTLKQYLTTNVSSFTDLSGFLKISRVEKKIRYIFLYEGINLSFLVTSDESCPELNDENDKGRRRRKRIKNAQKFDVTNRY